MAAGSLLIRSYPIFNLTLCTFYSLAIPYKHTSALMVTVPESSVASGSVMLSRAVFEHLPTSKFLFLGQVSPNDGGVISAKRENKIQVSRAPNQLLCFLYLDDFYLTFK